MLSPPYQIPHCCFKLHTTPFKIQTLSHHHHQSNIKTIPKSHYTTGIFYTIDKHHYPHHHHQNHQNRNNDDDYNEDDYDQSNFRNRFCDYSPIYLNDTQKEKPQIVTDKSKESRWGILSNMWWADLKAAVGQRINVEGLLFSVSVITKNRNWVIPHVSVPDIRYIDWAALKKKGFEGVVFDKDNTLTVPYSLALWGPISESVESCKSVFGNNIAVFSNSAGLQEYDPDGRKARAVEFVIGIRVIRHQVKKPAGSAEEIERHFGCDSSKLIMVGDRPFTDIVYGNRNGFLTILTKPLSLAEEPFIVRQVRRIELALVNRWLRKGLKPANQRLSSDPSDCVKELPPL
uniref:phosphatidylglycerophosphate phosphatase 1, chloroplastic/mitochondrial n=1 Tax=Erigeron canadensis TaxID=72917 RepID=UPI001CB9589B|nr:phosphatidylglycerophosphate phosphatase 1, chloroplastic/mitochondrial [Erigeron canadensis]